jgi:FKBP-type peptidyl-prolyl cis-trans isomerase
LQSWTPRPQKKVWTPAGKYDNHLNRLTKNGFRDGFDPAAGTTEMKIQMKLIQNAFLALLALNVSAQPAPPSSPAPGQRPMPRVPPALMQRQPMAPPVMPDKDKVSYAIGFNMASNIKRAKFDVDVDTLAAAMKDVFAERPSRFTEPEVKEILGQLNQALRSKQMAEREKEMTENKVKGEEYMAKNAKVPGVTTLPNGIQYKVLKEGSGPMPKPTDTVAVNYKGKFIDGTVFDQKDNYPTPVTGRTIRGWSEILPLMKSGSKWEVTIPPEFGYGPRGYQNIPPNSVLVFEMELLMIKGPSPAALANRPAIPFSAQNAYHPGPPAPPSTTVGVGSQIIKVPSKAELDKGAKIEVITNTAPNAQ